MKEINYETEKKFKQFNIETGKKVKVEFRKQVGIDFYYVLILIYHYYDDYVIFLTLL